MALAGVVGIGRYRPNAANKVIGRMASKLLVSQPFSKPHLRVTRCESPSGCGLHGAGKAFWGVNQEMLEDDAKLREECLDLSSRIIEEAERFNTGVRSE